MNFEKTIDFEKHKRLIAIIMSLAVMLSMFVSLGTEKVYAADGTISLKVGRVIDYSSHFTHYFYAGEKDNPVYCSQPQLLPPDSGTYSYNFIKPDSMLAKCLYYGYGGPGFDEYTDKKLRGEWDGDDERIFMISKSGMHHEIDRGCELSGVKRIRVHDLRHSHISMLIDMGFSPVDIANRVGHENIDITMHYAHMFPKKQVEIAKRLSSVNDWQEVV